MIRKIREIEKYKHKTAKTHTIGKEKYKRIVAGPGVVFTEWNI